MKRGPKPKSIRQRFGNKYVAIEPGGCWVWIAALNGYGYGKMRVGSLTDGSRRVELAHRLSWCLHRGSIPAGSFVCHRCDVPVCVNPDHLFLGSHADNMADMAAKGRASTGGLCGEAHGMAKLTNANVSEIRALGVAIPHRKIAARFDVSRSQISRIIKGTSWSSQAVRHKSIGQKNEADRTGHVRGGA